MKKKGHLALKILLVLVLICAVAAGAGYWLFKTQFYDQTNYVEKGTYGTSGFYAEDMISAGQLAGQTARKVKDGEAVEEAAETTSEAVLSSEDRSEERR